MQRGNRTRAPHLHRRNRSGDRRYQARGQYDERRNADGSKSRKGTARGLNGTAGIFSPPKGRWEVFVLDMNTSISYSFNPRSHKNSSSDIVKYFSNEIERNFKFICYFSQYRNKKENSKGTEDLFHYRQIFFTSVFVGTIFDCIDLRCYLAMESSIVSLISNTH